MTTETQTSTGDVWTYSYDYRNRMTGAVEKTSTGTVLAQVTMTYDALDNRIGMDENGTQTWTLYDGSAPVMDFSSSGSLTMRYLWGPTGILARQTSGGTVSWYLADALGTVRDLINNTGGIIDHVDFSAFGTVLGETSPTNGDRFVGFAGMERDTVTGLSLAVEREENPGTGRWDSQDRAGFWGGSSNTFSYVGNSPTAGADPTGLRPAFARYPKPPTDPECLRLMQKIQNVRRSIGRRISDLREDLGDLPETCPGDDVKPRLSRSAHRRLINEDRKLLAALMAEYCWKCTGMDPPVLPPPVKVPVPVTNPQTNTGNLVVAGGGLILAGLLLVGGSVLEDFFTGGLGLADDPPSFAVGGGLIYRGGAILVGAW
jgi:RHS repeat-associated protein